jgi:hypothetical protein
MLARVLFASKRSALLTRAEPAVVSTRVLAWACSAGL